MARLPIDNTDRFCQWLLEESTTRVNSDVCLATGFYSEPTKGADEGELAYCLKVDDLNRQ